MSDEGEWVDHEGELKVESIEKACKKAGYSECFRGSCRLPAAPPSATPVSPDP